MGKKRNVQKEEEPLPVRVVVGDDDDDDAPEEVGQAQAKELAEKDEVHMTEAEEAAACGSKRRKKQEPGGDKKRRVRAREEKYWAERKGGASSKKASADAADAGDGKRASKIAAAEGDADEGGSGHGVGEELVVRHEGGGKGEKEERGWGALPMDVLDAVERAREQEKQKKEADKRVQAQRAQRTAKMEAVKAMKAAQREARGKPRQVGPVRVQVLRNDDLAAATAADADVQLDVLDFAKTGRERGADPRSKPKRMNTSSFYRQKAPRQLRAGRSKLRS